MNILGLFKIVIALAMLNRFFIAFISPFVGSDCVASVCHAILLPYDSNTMEFSP